MTLQYQSDGGAVEHVLYEFQIVYRIAIAIVILYVIVKY